MASSNAPSNTNITVPLPAPGSVVPQKYSACSISTSLYMLLSYWYTVRLYKRPQFREASLTRMLNKFTPDDGNAPPPLQPLWPHQMLRHRPSILCRFQHQGLSVPKNILLPELCFVQTPTKKRKKQNIVREFSKVTFDEPPLR